MDLFTSLLVIFILILFSFGSYILFSKLPRGKTFEEALAEKKQLAEKIYALSAGHGNKKTNKNKKINNNKKQGKSSKVNKKESESPEESDVNSDVNPSNDSPVHHVEFSEAEIISDSEPKKTKNNSKKRNSKTTGSGILINKSEPIAVKSEPIVEELNHFEIIHPKDDVEKFKAQVRTFFRFFKNSFCFNFSVLCPNRKKKAQQLKLIRTPKNRKKVIENLN